MIGASMRENIEQLGLLGRMKWRNPQQKRGLMKRLGLGRVDGPQNTAGPPIQVETNASGPPGFTGPAVSIEAERTPTQLGSPSSAGSGMSTERGSAEASITQPTVINQARPTRERRAPSHLEERKAQRVMKIFYINRLG